MKTAAKGFLLFELLFASVVAGLVITAAMQTYIKILKFEQQLNAKNSFIANIERVKTQIFNDFNNAFIPAFYTKNPEAEKDSKSIFFECSDETFGPKSPDSIPFKSKIFGVKLTNFAQVSFCTTNVMIFGKENPAKITRVTYLVEKQPQTKIGQDFFSLYRIETNNLWLAPTKKELEKAFKLLLIENLTECTMTFTPKKSSEEKNSDEEIESKFYWGKVEEEFTKLPAAVHFRAVADNLEKNWTLDIFVPLLCAGGEIEPKKPQETKPTEKTDAENKETDKKDLDAADSPDKKSDDDPAKTSDAPVATPDTNPATTGESNATP